MVFFQLRETGGHLGLPGPSKIVPWPFEPVGPNKLPALVLRGRQTRQDWRGPSAWGGSPPTRELRPSDDDKKRRQILPNFVRFDFLVLVPSPVNRQKESACMESKPRSGACVASLWKRPLAPNGHLRCLVMGSIPRPETQRASSRQAAFDLGRRDGAHSK